LPHLLFVVRRSGSITPANRQQQLPFDRAVYEIVAAAGGKSTRK
jgi:hypothetical protein